MATSLQEITKLPTIDLDTSFHCATSPQSKLSRCHARIEHVSIARTNGDEPMKEISLVKSEVALSDEIRPHVDRISASWRKASQSIKR